MSDTGAKGETEADYTSERRALLIADASVAADRAAEAVALSGWRIAARLDWDAATARLGDHPVFEVMLVEAEGVAAERLAAVLPRIDTLARTTGMPVVIALAEHQIDLVAAHVFGGHAQLLCHPGVADRVAALALAGAGADGARLNDSAGESETARLKRLYAEIARIAETLARLTQLDGESGSSERPAGIVGDRTLGYGAPPAEAIPVAPQDLRNAIRSRRLRDQFFAAAWFEDPAWDMLLDLRAAELERQQVSVSSLCIAAAVAPTTALRWISKMTDAGLFERRPDPNDRRRVFMGLSETARKGMESYLGAVRRAGLPIA